MSAVIEDYWKVDPLLELDFVYEACSVNVCRVKRAKSQYILKYACGSKSWDVGHLQREIQVLQAAAGVRGVTQLVEVYDSPGKYLAILKEFFPGHTLRELGRKPRLPMLRESLEAILSELHERGIANLDVDSELGRNNIVYSHELRQAKIIDPASKVGEMLYHDKSSQAYNRAKERDLANIKMLFA